jgi:hypothetical protein
MCIGLECLCNVLDLKGKVVCNCCVCFGVHAGAGWPLNRPPAAGWANRPSQYLRGAFALVERIGTSNQYEGRQSWTDDRMHEMSVQLNDGMH